MRAPGLETEFIHRFVRGKSRARTLLLLHGTGGDESDLLSLGQTLAPEASLLSPRGKVLENGMPRFFRRTAEGVFDREDLVARTHELADFVATSATRHGFDAANVWAVGYSNGANIAGGLLLLRPKTLAGAILFRPMLPLVPESLPDLSGTPVFIGAGRHDAVVPLRETERLGGLFRRAGADVTVAMSGTAHALSQSDVASARRWLALRDSGAGVE